MPDAKLKTLIIEYSTKNAYVAEQFAEAKCDECGCDTFMLVMNETEGVAARFCSGCESEHGIGDSDEFVDEVEEVYQVECSCGAKQFKIMAGVALYDNSDDVRWFYLGCRCVGCDQASVYGDWKSEFNNYRELLAKI